MCVAANLRPAPGLRARRCPTRDQTNSTIDIDN